MRSVREGEYQWLRVKNENETWQVCYERLLNRFKKLLNDEIERLATIAKENPDFQASAKDFKTQGDELIEEIEKSWQWIIAYNISTDKCFSPDLLYPLSKKDLHALKRTNPNFVMQTLERAYRLIDNPYDIDNINQIKLLVDMLPNNEMLVALGVLTTIHSGICYYLAVALLTGSFVIASSAFFQPLIPVLTIFLGVTAGVIGSVNLVSASYDIFHGVRAAKYSQKIQNLSTFLGENKQALFSTKRNPDSENKISAESNKNEKTLQLGDGSYLKMTLMTGYYSSYAKGDPGNKACEIEFISSQEGEENPVSMTFYSNECPPVWQVLEGSKQINRIQDQIELVESIVTSMEIFHGDREVKFGIEKMQNCVARLSQLKPDNIKYMH